MPRIFRSAQGWACLISAAAALTLTGCNSVKTYPTVHNARITGPVTKQSCSVHKGQTLTVRLPTQAGASYTWRISPKSVDNGYIFMESRKEQQRAEGGLARPGEPAWDIFVFNAKHTGEIPMEFFYDYGPSPQATPNQRYLLKVGVVKPDRNSPPPSMASGERN